MATVANRVTALEKRVKALETAVAALTPTAPTPTPNPTPVPASTPGRTAVVWWPGWTQDRIPTIGVDFSAWSQINHFGCYPTKTGSVVWTDIHGTQAATIAAAHAAGRRCVLTVGSEGFGAQFVASTAASYIDSFVASMWAAVTSNGYDGLDVDWEEQVTQAPYVSLLSKLNATRPAGKSLSIAVDLGQHPAKTVAAVEWVVDQVNVMTYWDSGVDEVNSYLAAGVPASKLVLGIGFDASYYDVDAVHVSDKTATAQRLGLAGVCAWSLDKLSTPWSDPRLVPLRAFVSGG